MKQKLQYNVRGHGKLYPAEVVPAEIVGPRRGHVRLRWAVGAIAYVRWFGKTGVELRQAGDAGKGYRPGAWCCESIDLATGSKTEED